MNTMISSVSNVWTALVFGAVFNWLMASPSETLFAFAIKTAIGGAIWFVFQLMADYIKNKNARKISEKNTTQKSKKKKP